MLEYRDERDTENLARIAERHPAVQIVALFDGLALQWSLDPQRVDAVGAMRGFLQGLGP